MSTFNKIKISFMVSAVSTVFAAALKTLAMFFEFDREIGYFNHNAPINLAANIFTVVAVLFFIAFSFLFKKREIFPVINYSSSLFRFFSSTSGCFMLVYAYVKWQEYLSSKELFSNVSEKKVNFLFATAILAAVSGFALMVYAFGKNEKNNPMRSFLAVCPAGVALLRAIEIQFDGDIEMNDPMKISLQLASLALILGIVYTAKCEFDIHETTPHMRLITLMVTPVVVLSFAIPTIICYYTKVNALFTYLVDAILYLSLCGFVVFSYTPCKKAKEICDEKWNEYDEKVAELNKKDTDEEDSLSSSESSEEADDVQANTDEQNASDENAVNDEESENE